MKRIELREGQAFQRCGKVRRIAGIFTQNREASSLFDAREDMHVVYSQGGDRTYRCRRAQFLRWMRGADEITNAAITIEGQLV